MKSIALRVGTWACVLGAAMSFGFAQEKEPGSATAEEALAHAKGLKDPIEATLGIKLGTFESDHFLIHSDCSAGQRDRILRSAESTYKKLNDLLPMDEGQSPWLGKYVILYFKDRDGFVNYWKKVRKTRAKGELAASFGTGFGKGVTGFVANAPKRSSSRFKGSLGFHLPGPFIDAYKGKGKVPAWLQWGFRGYCAITLNRDKKQRAQREKDAKETVAIDKRPLHGLLKTRNYHFRDSRSYALCFSLIDFMFSRDKEKFAPFVARVKQGTDHEQAIQETFGMSFDEFEKAWLAFIDKNY